MMLARRRLSRISHKPVVRRGLFEPVQLGDNGLPEAAEAQGDHVLEVVIEVCAMPEMDGYETTVKIREAERSTNVRIPIIAVPANAMHGDREKCLNAGMDNYIAKPFQAEVLTKMLEKYAARVEENRSALQESISIEAITSS